MYSLPYSYMVPPLVFWFMPVVALSTSDRLTPKCFIFCGCISIWYSFMSPPNTDTWATPPIDSSLGLMVQSAKVRRSNIEVLSAVRPTISTSPSIDDCGPSVGVPTLSGSSLAIADSFSETICLAMYISVDQSNSTHTTEKPAVDDERTRLTPVAPFTAVSIGNVTSCSTSSAAMPLASVITTTVGAFRSGKTSTSVLWAVNPPSMISATAATRTIRRLCSENRIILLSIRF